MFIDTKRTGWRSPGFNKLPVPGDPYSDGVVCYEPRDGLEHLPSQPLIEIAVAFESPPISTLFQLDEFLLLLLTASLHHEC